MLLDVILHSRDLRLLMRSTHLPTTKAYERLSRKMASRGHECSPQQIRSKFKTVKNNFFSSLESWQGMPRESGQMPHHLKMMALWDDAGKLHWEDHHHSGMHLFK